MMIYWCSHQFWSIVMIHNKYLIHHINPVFSINVFASHLDKKKLSWKISAESAAAIEKLYDYLK